MLLKESIDKMVREMVMLQNRFNTKTNGDNWYSGVASNGKPILWDACIGAEVGELIESTPYKHWKATSNKDVDVKNVQIEIVDIWHFVMSAYISNTLGSKMHLDILISYLTNSIFEYIGNIYTDKAIADFKELGYDTYEHIVYAAMEINKSIVCVNMDNVDDDSISPPHITLLATMFTTHLYCVSNGLGMFTFEDLYKLYIGKNALNEVRQLNGYKDGTYVKIWGDAEDNVYMQELLTKIAVVDITYDKLVNMLDKYYKDNVAIK